MKKKNIYIYIYVYIYKDWYSDSNAYSEIAFRFRLVYSYLSLSPL